MARSGPQQQAEEDPGEARNVKLRTMRRLHVGAQLRALTFLAEGIVAIDAIDYFLQRQRSHGAVSGRGDYSLPEGFHSRNTVDS